MGRNYVTGERIKQKRLEKKWSMEKLAEKVGLNRTTIMRYETGDVQNISTKKLFQIADALDVNVDWLMGYDENIKDEPIKPITRNISKEVREDKEFQRKEYDRGILIDYLTQLTKLDRYLLENDFSIEEIDELIKYAGFMILKRKK